MHLASLNVDVLLHLIEFVNPVDRFNLVLSGILKGFENVDERIDLRQRSEYIEVKLGLRRYSMCQLEIRSLVIIPPDDDPVASESLLVLLERLAEKDFFQNNRKLYVLSLWPLSPLLLRVGRFMNNLERVDLSECDVTFENLAHLFRPCPKIVKLNLKLLPLKKCKMNEDLKNEIRLGFQKLRYIVLQSYIDNNSWSVLQEILTWPKDCVKLLVQNFLFNIGKPIDFVNDGSLTPNPELAKNLRILELHNVPIELARWFLPCCLSICTLNLRLTGKSNGVQNIPFEQLKEVGVFAGKTSKLREFFSVCRQVEILQVYTDVARLQDFDELQSTESLKDVRLNWEEGLFIGDILPIVKKWRNLRRLTLISRTERSVLQLKLLCDFILGMKHLTYLEIILNCVPPASLRDKIHKIVLPRRPNFEFNVSHNLRHFR